MQATVDADISIIARTFNSSVISHGQYHDNIILGVKFIHVWVWAPLACYFLYCVWRCINILDILQAKFFMTGTKSVLNERNPKVKKCIGIAANVICWMLAPFVGGCFYACFFEQGKRALQVEMYPRDMYVRKLESISHSVTLSVYIAFVFTGIILCFFETEMQMLQTECLLKHFEKQMLLYCERATPKAMKEFMEEIRKKTDNVDSGELTNKRLTDVSNRIHQTLNEDKVILPQSSRVANPNRITQSFLPNRNKALTLNTSKVMAQFNNSSRRDLDEY